ncbi:MAG: diaminopimelate epimerase [Lachnospiraceae bacterium]|nr:diaminopimelate epimerase [Lachnospiraceae bacterium]
MHFTKMQGLGNDYLYVYGSVPSDIVSLSQKLSDRHFGIGSDGMIYISPSLKVDFTMRIFNADGSEAMMCGNGIRCVGKYVYDKGYSDKKHLKIETLSGIKELDLDVRGGTVRNVTVNMGKSVAADEMQMKIKENMWTMTPVSVGNPHAVIFVENAETAPVDSVGPVIEHSSLFPGGVNVEFVQYLDSTNLRMRVWERGSGITMACGTGACAAATAAVKKGYCEQDTPLNIHLDGGVLTIQVNSDGYIFMTGSAETICEGDVEL